jgi:hypothetical protein
MTGPAVGTPGSRVIFQNDDSAAYEWMANAKEWKAHSKKLEAEAEDWKAHARETHKDYDDTMVSLNTWKSTLKVIRDEFAPQLTNDGIMERYNELRPIEKEKYYEEYRDHWGKYS